VPDADRIHAVDRYWRMIELLGGGHLQKEFRVPVDGDAVNRMLAVLQPLPQPWIAVAPGARWLTKRWPVEKFTELLNQTQNAFGGTAVLLGAPDDITLSVELASSLKHPCVDLTGKTSIAEMVAVLSRSSVMISNDTGPLHVAAALGVPCVAAYLCTKVNLHGPYLGASPMSAGVPTTVPCAGSYVRQCPNGLRCFTDITVDALAKEVSRIMTA
jgi:heptosyltransferase-1